MLSGTLQPIPWTTSASADSCRSLSFHVSLWRPVLHAGALPRCAGEGSVSAQFETFMTWDAGMGGLSAYIVWASVADNGAHSDLPTGGQRTKRQLL